MPPLQPLNPNDFARLFAPVIPLPVMPSLPPVMNVSPNPPPTGGGGNSNTLIYVGIGLLAVGVIVLTVYVVTERNETTRFVLQARVEVKELRQQLKTLQGSSNLLVTSKTINNGNTEKPGADSEPEQPRA